MLASTTNTTQGEKEQETRRYRLFSALALALSLILIVAGTFEFIPAWIEHNPADQVHLWHIAELSALAIFLLGGVMIRLAFRAREEPLLAQFMALSLAILGMGILPFSVGGMGLLVLAGVFAPKTAFASSTQCSILAGHAVLIILPENLLFTRFSSKLIVSTRAVTPTTAIPLPLPAPVRHACAVSSRQ